MTFQGTRSAKLPDPDMGQWTGYPDPAPLVVTDGNMNVSISRSVRNADTTPLQRVAMPSLTNPVKHLDHAKREVVRYFDIPANAIESAVRSIEEGRT
jgi:hypothetical protein